MHKITLFFSVHHENGLCNAEELLTFLRAFEPDAIFEEVRPSDFDYYYKTKWSLEAQAITKYREYKLPQQVPVDRYDIPEHLLPEIKREFDCVFDYVEQTSQKYRELWEEHNNSVHQYGFKYLNDVACATMMARISEIEEKTINETRDQGLILGLKKWRHSIQRREFEMISNIYEYSRENVFDTGVFLVGAAHKTGIVKEIEKYASTEADQINWNFACDGQVR
jgi:hypothetical protein